MEKEEIIKKLNEIRKTRILDIYSEKEFSGEGIVINQEGKMYKYKWQLALCIEENKAKEIYSLEEYKIDPNKMKINYKFDNNKKDNCINIINYNNLKIENNDINYYKKIMKEVLKWVQ